jgi:hypothetical protein
MAISLSLLRVAGYGAIEPSYLIDRRARVLCQIEILTLPLDKMIRMQIRVRRSKSCQDCRARSNPFVFVGAREHNRGENSTTIGDTFATQWVATAPFLAEPYRGSNAYITHDEAAVDHFHRGLRRTGAVNALRRMAAGAMPGM